MVSFVSDSLKISEYISIFIQWESFSRTLVKKWLLLFFGNIRSLIAFHSWIPIRIKVSNHETIWNKRSVTRPLTSLWGHTSITDVIHAIIDTEFEKEVLWNNTPLCYGKLTINSHIHTINVHSYRLVRTVYLIFQVHLLISITWNKLSGQLSVWI